MSATTFNALSVVLGIAVLIALLAAIISLVAMIVRWRTPRRRGYAISLLICLAAVPCLIGVQQFLLWRVFLPALGREKVAQMNAARAERLAKTSLVQVGDAAPEFSVTTIDGETLSVPAPGKVVLLNFFATWCGPCRLELPHINRVWAQYKNDDRVRFIVIGREETPETVEAFQTEHNFSVPMAADPDRAIYSRFAKESIPRTFVIAPNGQIVYAQAGFHESDIEELKALLENQLATTQ
jgi:peroxiredoxin